MKNQPSLEISDLQKVAAQVDNSVLPKGANRVAAQVDNSVLPKGANRVAAQVDNSHPILF